MMRKFAAGFVLGMAVAAGFMWVRSALNANAVSPEPVEETAVAFIQTENSNEAAETGTAVSKTKVGVPDAFTVQVAES